MKWHKEMKVLSPSIPEMFEILKIRYHKISISKAIKVARAMRVLFAYRDLFSNLFAKPPQPPNLMNMNSG